MASSVTLNWNLDRSTETMVSVAKDVIRAATSDNVQALALLACERFGATLAICPETTKKIEDLIVRVSGPTVIKFLSAQVGYSAHDCTIQLSRSLAGVQFLALAAALVSSVEMYEGADAVSMMLAASAADKTLLPTARQLKDLMAVTEHRLNRSGFTDMCVGYQIMLLATPGMSDEQRDYWRCSDCYPKPDGIATLVNAFRELARIGETTAVTIRAGSCTPWVMAFTRWCLGIPPSLSLEDGTMLLDQPDSRVSVLANMEKGATTFDVTFDKAVDSPGELLQSETSPNRFTGMVSIERLGQWACQEMGGERSDAYRAMAEALPYALKQTCELLRLAPIDNSLADMVAKPFPQDLVICNALAQFLSSERRQRLPTVDPNHRLMEDVPLVAQHLRRLEKDCPYKSCQHSPDVRQKQYPYFSGCKKETFLEKLAHFTAEVLAFSVFESTDTLLVNLRCRKQNSSLFEAMIYTILETGERGDKESIEPVLAWILACVGHDHGVKDVIDRKWVISSFKGQAVYPKMFQMGKPDLHGFLTMSWAPGLLRFNGEVYTRGLSPGNNSVVPSPETQQMWDAGTIPLNVASTLSMKWEVAHRSDYLEIWLSCGRAIGLPYDILRNLCLGVVLENRPHGRDSPLRRANRFSAHRAPFFVERPRVNARLEPEVSIVDVEADGTLQLFALSRIPDLPFVVRKNACVQCCLDVCQKAKISMVLF